VILTVALLVALGWLWKRGHFVRENLVTPATLRRIRRESANEGAEKDQAEMTRGRRILMDGPRSRYTTEFER
jgi:hypothetical protein